jgi:hypothetical protein
MVRGNMFLENCLTMPHTGGRGHDRNRKEDIQQAMIQNPWKSRQYLDDTCYNHWCGRDGPIPWPAKLTSNRRLPRPLHISLWKCCAPCVATCPRGMNCAAAVVAVMLSVDVLEHESDVPPTYVRTISW